MRYFIVSDIHSFYTEFRKSIYKAGFRLNNPEHKLVILGDLFDRGKESVELFKFLQRHNKKIIYVCGNHEELFLELTEKHYVQTHDFTNGTLSTFLQFAGTGDITLSELQTIIKAHPVYKLIERIAAGPRYIEIGNYVLCHSTPFDTWGNPYQQNRIQSKTIVFGHWDIHDGNKYTDGEIRDNIFYGDGLIGVDSGCYIKGYQVCKNKMGVFVIDDSKGN